MGSVIVQSVALKNFRPKIAVFTELCLQSFSILYFSVSFRVFCFFVSKFLSFQMLLHLFSCVCFILFC